MIATRQFRKAMREIAAAKGNFTLFGLFRRANALGTWDLVVSAPWLENGPLKRVRELDRLLSRSLGKVALRQFSRIAVLGEDDEGLEALLASISVDDGEVRVKQPEFFRLELEDAIIFRAKRAA